MGLGLEYLANDPTPEAQNPQGEFAKSLRGGFLSAEGQVNSYAGALGSAAGFNDFAAERHARAAELENESQLYAPRVGSYKDVKSLNDGWDYVKGLAGGSMPSMALGTIGGAIAGLSRGRINPLVAGTVAQFPLEAGDVAQRQQADPVARQRSALENLRDASASGLVSSVAQSIVPAALGGKLVGATMHGAEGAAVREGFKGANFIGSTARAALKDAGVEGLSEGLGEAAKQQGVEVGRAPDWNAIGENVVGGAVLGAGMGTAGHVAEHAYAAPMDMARAAYRRANNLGEGVKTKAGEVVDLANGVYDGSVLQSGVDKASAAAGNFVGSAKRKAGDIVDLARDDQGNVDMGKAFGEAKQGIKDGATDLVDKYRMSQDDRDTLNMDMPASVDKNDQAQTNAWFDDTMSRRGPLVQDRLGAMAGNDPKAADLLARIQAAPDHEAQQDLVDDGATHILNNSELEKLATRADNAAATAGALAAKAGGLLGKGGMAVGKGLLRFGKSVVDGAKNTDGERKLNAQANEGSTESMQDFDRRMNMAAGIAENASAEHVKTTNFARAPIPDLVKQTVMKLSALAPGFKEKGMSKGSTLSLNTMADTLRVGLGDYATSTMAEMQAVAPKETHPLFDYLRKEMATAATPQGRRARAEMRRDAGNELMALLPPEHADAIMKHEAAGTGGVSRERLMGMVEQAGDGDAQATSTLTQLFGKENFAKALGIANHVTEDTHPQGEAATFNGEADALETKQAEKTVANTSAPKLYGFGNGLGLTDSNNADPFAVTRSATGTKRLDNTNEEIQRVAEGQGTTAGQSGQRPNIVSKDKKLFDGTSAIDSMVARLQKTLKVDQTPENMARIMKEEGNPEGAAAVQKHIEAAAGGREASKKVLDAATEPFFMNRAGSYSVTAQSAASILKAAGTDPTKVLALHRDYLRQEARQEGTPIAERRAMLAQAALTNRVIADAMDVQDGKGASTVGRAQARTMPVERKAAHAAADAFFNDRHLAVAEQLSDRDPNTIDISELLKLGRDGAKSITDTESGPAGNRVIDHEARDAKNVLTFQSDVSPRQGSRDLHINANQLAGLGRKQRMAQGDSEQSGPYKNADYLRDLSDGIAVVMNSGMVDNALPTKTNKYGKVESFDKGLPPSLRLASSTVGGMEWSRDQKAEANQGRELKSLTQDERDQAVGKDQARSEEPHVNDPWEGTEHAGTEQGARGKTFESMDAAKAAATADVEVGANSTPLDRPKKAAKGAAPDEFDDQQYRSELLRSDTSGAPKAEIKLSAQSNAPRRGEKILSDLRGDFGAGMDALNTRLRNAQRPAFTREGEGAAGGGHYIYPAAYALSMDRISALDLGPKEMSQVSTARAKTADIVSKAKDLSDTQKLALTKMLAPEASRDKITKDNFQRVLDKAAQSVNVTAAPEVAAALPKSVLPGGAAETGFTLQPRGPFTPKDQAKASQATAFIGRGSATSSTSAYGADARAAGIPANAGKYTASDKVFVSAEGARGGRVSPDLAEISKALAARATILTDDPANRSRDYNVGERQVEAHLKANGYEESKPGTWTPAEPKVALPSGAAETPRMQNAQDARDGNSRVASQADMDEARSYVDKVLGPGIKVDFEALTGHSGEWIEAANTIKISTTAAAGVMHTAYHEALHAFFSKYVKGDERVLQVMKSLADNPAIIDRVHALLHEYPAAQAQLKNGEERLAYIYQFWAAGALDLPVGQGRTWMQKISKFFRRVLGRVQDSERAAEIMEMFHKGALAEPSAAGQVIAGIMSQGEMSVRARRKFDGMIQATAAGTLASEVILLNSKSARSRLLAREMYTNPGDAGAAKYGEGYLNARRNNALKFNNEWAKAIDGMSARDLKDVASYMQKGTDPADIPYAPHAVAAQKLRAVLARIHDYLVENGVNVGHIEKYFPVTWDTGKLINQREAFVNMLTTHYGDVLDQGLASARQDGMTQDDIAGRIWKSLIDKRGGDNKIDANREDGVLVPFFESGEHRVLDWIAPEHREPFLEKNLIGIMSRYTHQSVRAAEYTKRFGAEGEQLDGALREIHNELVVESKAMLKRGEFDEEARDKWVQRQVRDVRHAVGAMEGTLGKDISPALRKFNSYMMVYQNVRVLPLALFSSFVDPLAIIARGGEMKHAYDAFLGGMKEVFRNWGNEFRDVPKAKQRTQWDALAETIGAIDSEIFNHYVSDEYSGGYMANGAKKINDKMFMLNGMEAWNRSMRVGATKAAVSFLVAHKSLPNEHSARWLAELGLTPKEIALDSEGKLITSRHVLAADKGISLEQATEDIKGIHLALNRWVEGAILTPNAAQRPSWASDPRFSLLFHLKQFSYSFHQTVLKRAVNELKMGNLAPMGVFAWYVPVMIASDITKGLLVGGGELPNYMKAYNAGDWVMHGANRAGLLGAGTIATDAGHNPFSLAGPAMEQVINGIMDPIGKTAVNALPLHGLFQEALKGSATVAQTASP